MKREKKFLTRFELFEYFKRQKRYMTVKEVAKETNQTIQSISRKVKKMTPRYLCKKVRKIKVGEKMGKQKVSFYKVKTK